MSWGRLPRPNPCVPCMVGNPKATVRLCHVPTGKFHQPCGARATFWTLDENGGPRSAVCGRHTKKFKRVEKMNPGDVHVHVDMPKAHAASGRGRTVERNMNPKLMVLNPSSALEAACAKKLGRRLSSKEKSLLAAACREFKTFHGREPKAEDLVPVDVPPGTPMFVMGIGKVERQNYTVPMESERRGKWTHKAGDHGGKHETKAPWFASIPGRSKHNVVIAQPPGAKTYFKPTHGLMG